MAISSIILQPAADQLMAAYRPIVYRVAAIRTDGQPVPPVVYCDIYFDGTYYKSQSKTQCVKLNISNSEFEFDISDAVQEFLKYQLPVNGGSVILEASSTFKQCFCRFRSSGYDIDGFLTVEDVAPVQGTGSQLPFSGTGFLSNTCTVINATLQHEDNQDLGQHLTAYRTSLNWDENVLPLTHRPRAYKVCPGDSDYFPFIDNLLRDYRCIRLNYKLKGQSNFTTVQYCIPVLLKAQDDYYDCYQDWFVSDYSPGILANDSDSDGNAITATAGTFPTTQGGQITVTAAGSFTYYPAVGFLGEDTFIYTVSNQFGATASATIHLNVIIMEAGFILFWGRPIAEIPAGWAPYYGENGGTVSGKYLVQPDPADPDFNTPGKTGGGKNHTILASQIPNKPHRHPLVGNSVGGDGSSPILGDPTKKIAGSWGTDNNDEYDLQKTDSEATAGVSGNPIVVPGETVTPIPMLSPYYVMPPLIIKL